MLSGVMDAWRGTLGSMACPYTRGRGAQWERERRDVGQEARKIEEPPYTISSLKFEGRVRHRPTWAQKILSPGTNLGHVDRPLSSSGLLLLSQRHDLLLMVCRP